MSDPTLTDTAQALLDAWDAYQVYSTEVFEPRFEALRAALAAASPPTSRPSSTDILILKDDDDQTQADT